MDPGVFLALSAAGLLIVGSTGGIIALFWLLRLSRRVESLEREARGRSSAQRAASAAPQPSPPRAPYAPPTAPAPSVGGPFAPEADELAPPAAPEPAPPAAPVRPPPPPPPPRAPRPKIEWERWIGIRGAAVLGGVFLALSGLLLFQYSIEHNLISPTVRIGMGVFFGFAGLVGSELLRRRGAQHTANAAAGGGIVALYAAAWAASRLYGLISDSVAFGWMAAVTGLCIFLALRHSSQLISVLGLLGGLATPLLLAQDRANPAGLFGYLLLLDLGFLMVGWKRGWASLGIVAVLGTALLEVLFVGKHMAPEHLAVVLVSLGMLGMGFALSSAWAKGSRSAWLLSQAGGLATPLLFAIYFAQHAELGRHLLPLAGLGALLLGASFFVARRQNAPWMPIAMTSGALGIVATYLFSDPVLPERARELVIAVAILAVVLALGVELSRRGEDAAERNERTGLVAACAIGFGGFGALLGIGAAAGALVSPWPWFLGELLLASLSLRVAARARAPAFALLAAPLALLAVGPWSWEHSSRGDGRMPDTRFWAWLQPALVALLALAATLRRDAAGRRQAFTAAALAGVFLLLAPEAKPVWDQALVPWLLPATALAVVSLGAACFAGSRAPGGIAAMLAALAGGALLGWRLGQESYAMAARDELGPALVAFPAALLALFLVPLALRSRLATTRAAWRGLALVPWMLLPGMLSAFHHLRDEDTGVGLVPLLLLPGVALATWVHARRARTLADSQYTARVELGPARTAASWCGASALLLAAFAPAFEQGSLEGWVALGLAAPALAWLALRIRHAALARTAVVFVGFAALGLAAQLVEPHAFAASRSLLWTPISWCHLVPAAGALTTFTLLRRGESLLGPRETRIALGLSGLATVSLIFGWITFVILDAWVDEGFVRFSFERLAARDLALSLAWAVYALVLLLLGMRRTVAALRWTSLALFLATIAKVFLFDLGNLGGLYRVGSMLGLAVSLLFVSFLYQRFVFRRPATA